MLCAFRRHDGDPLLQEQSPAEFFKDHIESALARQRLRATGLTSYYLVDLLCRFVRPDTRIPFSDDPGEPLALRLRRALEAGGVEQRARLRNLGDFSLFMSGFYSDSLRRRSVDVDYYVSMGEYAYSALASATKRHSVVCTPSSAGNLCPSWTC